MKIIKVEVGQLWRSKYELPDPYSRKPVRYHIKIENEDRDEVVYSFKSIYGDYWIENSRMTKEKLLDVYELE